MDRIIKFVIQDILKNRIILFYTLVLATFSWSIFSLEDNTSKGVLSLLNIVLLTVPLVSVIFSAIYVYNSSEFIELLVSQPIKRSKIWWSLFLGLVLANNTAFLVGAGIPIVYYVAGSTGWTLVLAGCFLTTVFTSLAVLASILTRDKAKGIGLAIITWLFFTLIFDGLVLFLMFQFSDYPIEKGMVILSGCNPIDLARIMVLLQVDVSALLGYTGAVFKAFFGSSMGLIMSFLLLLFWAFIPFIISLKKFVNKDL